MHIFQKEKIDVAVKKKSMAKRSGTNFNVETILRECTNNTNVQLEPCSELQHPLHSVPFQPAISTIVTAAAGKIPQTHALVPALATANHQCCNFDIS